MTLKSRVLGTPWHFLYGLYRAGKSLQEVLDQGFVQELLGPLMERHWAALELIKRFEPVLERAQKIAA